MLNLKRSLSESLQIGDNIVITILSIRGNHVELGIDAPRDVPIVRQEVLERAAKRAAYAADSKSVDSEQTMPWADRGRSGSASADRNASRREPKVTYRRRQRSGLPDKG